MCLHCRESVKDTEGVLVLVYMRILEGFSGCIGAKLSVFA